MRPLLIAQEVCIVKVKYTHALAAASEVFVRGKNHNKRRANLMSMH